MSSWFSYFGFSKGPPLEEVREESEEDAQVPEQVVSKNTEEEIADAINRLSPEQQNLIQDVLRRAESSRKEAKVVVDAEMMRSRFRQRDSIEDSQEIDHRYSLIQMDSIPENMVTNEMEERLATTQNEDIIPESSQRSPITPRKIHEKRASITEVTTENLRHRFQKMKSHLTTWFNSLDYDGEYIFDFTSKPEKSEKLGELTMQYIDALSQAIMISSHIEYSHHVLSSNPKFQQMCTQFCESIFSVAFDELTYQLLDDKVQETLNEYCGQIAEEALQAAFFTMISKTLSKSKECEQVLNEISSMHKSRSFESAKQLDQLLSRIEDDRESSRKSSPYLYEVLGKSSDSPSTSASVEYRSQNSYESEISFETPDIHVEELFDTHLNEKDETKLILKSVEDKLETTEIEGNVPKIDENLIENIQYDSGDQEHYIWISGPLGRINEEHEDDFEARSESSSGSMITHSTEPKMQLNVEEYIQTMIARVSTENEITNTSNQTANIVIDPGSIDSEEINKLAAKLVEESILKASQEAASDNHEKERSSATSKADYERSFDQDVTYERSSPLLEPSEEPVMESKEPELTQEEIDHIARIQSLAEQSSFEQASTIPDRPPLPVRLPTVDEPIVISEQHEGDRSSATPGADYERSFDQDVTYERSSPLLEPSEEPVMLSKEAELTQEEIDHIAIIQSLAEKSSFEQFGIQTGHPFLPVRILTERQNDHDRISEEDNTSSCSSENNIILKYSDISYDRNTPLLNSDDEFLEKDFGASAESSEPSQGNWAKFEEISSSSNAEWPTNISTYKFPSFSEKNVNEDLLNKSSWDCRDNVIVDDVIEEEDENDLLGDVTYSREVNKDYWKDSSTIPLVRIECVSDEQINVNEETPGIDKEIKSAEISKDDNSVVSCSSENQIDHTNDEHFDFGQEDSEHEELKHCSSQYSFDSSLPPFHRYVACPSITPSEGDDGGSSETGHPTTDECYNEDVNRQIEQYSALASLSKSVLPVVEIKIDEATSESSVLQLDDDDKSISEQEDFIDNMDLTLKRNEDKTNITNLGASEIQQQEENEISAQTAEVESSDSWNSKTVKMLSDDSAFAEETQHVDLVSTSATKHEDYAEEQTLSQEEIDHIARITAMATEDNTDLQTLPTPQVRQNEPELSQKEIDHITRIAAMANKDFGMYPSIVSEHPAPVESELTQEELDHIARITEIASMDISTLPPPTGKPSETSLTQEELDHIARIAEMASAEYDVPVKIFEPPELTQEELDHIAKITAMAAQDVQLPATQRSITHKVSLTPPPPPPSKHFEQDLTQEELDHIARIAEMADMDYNTPFTAEPVQDEEEEPITESGSDATSGADIFDEQEDASSGASGSFDNNNAQVLTSGFSPDRVTSPAALDTTEEPQGPIMAQKTVSPTPSADSMASRKSSEYDIRSISEIRQESESDIGKWYEEQLSFMRQSIHDEEEDVGHEIRTDVEEFPLEYVEDQLHFLEGIDVESQHHEPTTSSAFFGTGRSIGEGEKRKYGDDAVEQQKLENYEEEEKTKSSSREAFDDGFETQREESLRAQQTPIDSLPGSRMLKRPNFGFLSNIANDAINKAKEAGSQIQAAVPIKPSSSSSNIVNNNVFSSSKSSTSLGTSAPTKSIPSPQIGIPMDGLSEEERRQIMSVMAAADFDDSVNNVKPSTSGSSNIPAGMEDLSEAEREKIMSVMANAEMEMGARFPPPSSQIPTRSPSVMSSSIMSELPPGLDDLSDDERMKIMAVMAEADMQNVRKPIARGPPPMPPSTSMIPPGMEGLSEEERQKIMSVMANAETDSSSSVITSRQPSRSPSVARMQPQLMPPQQAIPIIPPGLEGLSDEERHTIMSVMAEAEFEESRSQVPSRQPSRSPSFVNPQQSFHPIPSFEPIVPPGLEDLSEEERQKIMSVMMNAEVEESRSQLPSRQPSRSPSVAMIQAPAVPIIPSGMEDLPEAERQKIMSVMAEAEIQNFVPSRSPSNYSMQPVPVIPHGLEDLSEAERQKILSVMAEAEIDSAKIPSRSTSSYSMPPPLPQMSQPEITTGLEHSSEADMEFGRDSSRSHQVIPPGLENLSEEERQQIMSVMAHAELESIIPSGHIDQPISLPRGHTGFKPAGIVNEDELFETERKQREESPTRESGYATSTSYERELAMGDEERMDGLLEDIIRIREGARSRRDSRDEVLHRREEDPEVHTPEESSTAVVTDVPSVSPVTENVPEKQTDDFDFTYSDSRFAEIVQMQEEEEAGSLQKQKVDEKPRMWETVFDGDESELPHQDFVFNEPTTKKTSDFDFPKETDEVFEKPSEIQRIRVTKNHDVDMDEIYDNVIATEAPSSVSQRRQPVDSETSVKSRTIQRGPTKPPPMIKITVEEETKSDSDEESCSEDDEEYPDRVVAAPTAPAPTFEEVENERIRQEELGKEVLQQIMAFGEVANDEFDVQWAKTTTSQTPSTSTKPTVTAPKRSDPIPIAPSQRSKEIEEERIRTEALEEEEFYRHGHNPFLESPEEDEVSINMEDVEYAEIARLYESANQTMRRPGPVYTITEDESEDDGTLSNSESRLVAREKRLMDKKTADSLMAKYQKMKKVQAKQTTTASSTSVTATPAYAIINFSDLKTSTRTTDSNSYFETTKNIPALEIKDPKKDIPPEISASIDKTMAEVDALLGQVYTNEKAIPNLLCFDQSNFSNHPPTSSASTSTADDLILLKNNNSSSPSFLLPLQSSVLGSQLDSVRDDNERNENETTSPRGLKRSPGMLLPSPTSTSIFPMPPTAAESVGAAIGATTASMFGGISVADPPPTMDGLTNSYKWLQNIEDDGNLANNDMGRRKLPSIPPNSSAFPPPTSVTTNVISTDTSMPSTSSGPAPTYVDDYNVTLPSDPIVAESLLKGGSLTRRHQHQQQHQAPVYITSSASRPPSAAGSNIFQESRPTSSLSMYQNDVILSRPGSAASNYTTASTINPTILAGASYSSKASSHIRQPVSVRSPRAQTGTTQTTAASGSASNSIRPSIGSSSVTTRVPNTLARVLLKKELKDVLIQRKQRLEATEIEANQRHYKVQKMLITGLLPEKPEDDIPNIVKCDLPADLVRGVHISMQPPSPAVSAFSPRRYHHPTSVASHQSHPSTFKHMSKSIACQADELPPVKPMISLRTQLDMERRPQLMTYVGKRSAETQTELANYESITPTVRYGSIPRSSRERTASRRYREQQQQIYNQMPQNHNDLLEITKKYFEDYDRQLREFGERARRHSRRRFDFHDDDDQDDMRKNQVMHELARRKERMCASCEILSTTDPIRTALNPNVPMSSDYSSHVPHYGSLPRIDYPRGTRSDVRDFTYRQQHLPQQPPTNYSYNYGSLPRNFERGFSDLPPIEIENEQSFGAPPRHRSNLGYESTSMFNLSDPVYLGYDSIPMVQHQQPRVYDQIPSGYAQDTTNLNSLNQGVRGSDMVSQYASYLNSQFQSGLQQSAQLPQPMIPITRYDAPMSDPYVSSRSRLVDQMNQGYNSNQYHHHSTLLAPKSAQMTHIAPTYNQLAQQQGIPMQNTQMDPLMMSSGRIPSSSSQVYSRNEMNYGSRPAQSSLFEYGNRRQYGAAPPPTYDVPNVSSASDWRTTQQQGLIQQMPMQMQQQQHNTFDARWPKEDALSRMYATASRRRAQETALTSSNKISTGSRSYARRPIRPSSYRNPEATNSMPDRHVARRTAENSRYDVKRILLTRSYKHHNIYNDLGVRVVGGKRQMNGELSAYVSQLHSTANNQTLGQIKIGDEVVEWNGILLRGKTFEEVERIVNKSHGEIEMVIRTYKNPSSGVYDTLPLNRNTMRDDLSPDRVPPVPMHRINGINNNSVLHHHTLSDSSCHGHIQVSLGYDGNSRLVAKIIRARGLKSRDQSRSAPNPFVKVYLLPGRKVSHKRRTRFVDSSCAPEWNQVLEYQVAPHTLNTMFLEFTVCDYQRDVDDLPLGNVQIPLADKSAINTGPRWYPLQGSYDQPIPQHYMNGTSLSQIPSIAAASKHSAAVHNHHNHNYSEVPPSILYPKGGVGTRHPDKPVRHATFNYNPVSLDIGYPAIN